MKNKAYIDTIKVYNKLGIKYHRDSLKMYPPERKDFIQILPKGSTILDVGCAGGRDSKEFVRSGMNVVGIDLSEVFIKIAKKEVRGAKFFKMDVLDLKFSPKSFDAIWALAVLLHLERKDIPKALKNLYKVLKPDGILYIRVKKGKGQALVKEKLSSWQERFYTYFSKREIIDFFKKAGFKIIKSGIYPDELKRPDVKWVSVLARK